MKIHKHFEVTHNGEIEQKFDVYVIDKIELAKSEGGSREEICLGMSIKYNSRHKTIKGPAIILTRVSKKMKNIVAHECLHMAIELIRHEPNPRKNLNLNKAKVDTEENLCYCFDTIFSVVLKNL